MWKIVGGILLAIIILVIGVVYWGWTKLKSFANETGPLTVTIGAPVARVYGTMANGDSLDIWMSPGEHIQRKHGGPLSRGDTLTIERRTVRDSMPRESTMIVGDLKENELLTLELRASAQQLAAVRRFDMRTKGDSTEIVATVTSPLADSLMKATNAKSGAGRATMEFGSKMMLAAMRMQNDIELQRLKQHLDGTKPKYKTP